MAPNPMAAAVALGIEVVRDEPGREPGALTLEPAARGRELQTALDLADQR